MSLCKITLKPKEEIRIVQGHPWVYNNEISRFEGDIQSGEIAYVYAANGKFVGKGFLNTSSKIFVRILSRNEAEVIDEEFFRQRIHRAHQCRLDLGYANSYRALFAEADGIPGFIVDKYADYLVIQVLSLGIDQRKEMFIRLLVEEFAPKGIYERSDVGVRIKEGLLEYKGVVYGEVPHPVLIQENELWMEVDVQNGQKTGTFLDQQGNHAALRPYVRGKSVLDCFSNIGGFGLHAALYGAKNVICADLSALAVEQIMKNACLNHLENVEAIRADVFQLLRDYQKENRLFDVVILDPPAFTKNAENLEKAFAGYKEINLQAMKIIQGGGYLVTCSCSHYMTPELFLQMLLEAANDSNRLVQMVEFRIQGKDHPTLLGSEESLYLKCVILRIDDKL